MKNRVVIKDQEELRYISELFNEKYNDLNLRDEDLDCEAENVKLMVQPRCVTYTRVQANPSLEYVFHEAVRCLQPYMADRAKSIILMRERFNFMVNVDMSQIPHIAYCPDRIEQFCQNLEKLRFSFSWEQKEFTDEVGILHPSVNYNYSGIIFIGHVKSSSSNVYRLHINPMAVPYLTFIGQEMGRTQFDSDILNSLDTSYSKRFYLLLCDWAMRGGLMRFGLEEFKDMLGIKDSYKYGNIKDRVLNLTLSQLENLGSDLHFTYKEIYDAESKRRPRVSEIEFFAFYSKGKQSVEMLKKALSNCLASIADQERRNAIEDAVDKIIISGHGSRLLNKFKYYGEKVKTGGMNEDEFKNVLLKIVRESFDIELRSDVHVRNARKRKFISIVEKE